MHATSKVYFIELFLKIKYCDFEDKSLFIFKNLWECERFPGRRLKSIYYQELEKTNTKLLSAKVANDQFDQIHCDDGLQNVLFRVVFSFTT